MLYNLHNNEWMNSSSLADLLCLRLFHFTYGQIKRIVKAMGFQSKIVFREGTLQSFSWDSAEAIAIMLRRLAYPSRFMDLQLLFGIHRSTICLIFNSMIKIIHNKFYEGIRYNKKHLNSFNLKRLNRAIIEKGSSFECIVGFIDGDINCVCRPVEN
jgi:hypothetical protein